MILTQTLCSESCSVLPDDEGTPRSGIVRHLLCNFFAHSPPGILSFLRIPQSLRFRRKGLLWAYPGGLADFAAFWSPPAPPAPCNLASLLSSWPPGLPHPGPWISLSPLAFLSLSFLLSPPSGLSHLSLLRFCCVSLILKVLLGKVNTFGM